MGTVQTLSAHTQLPVGLIQNVAQLAEYYTCILGTVVCNPVAKQNHAIYSR